MRHLRDVIAVAAALGAALGYAASSVMQQRAAQDEPADEALKPGLLLRLVCQPLWLAGLAADGLAYMLQFVALGHGSITVVQLLLVSGLLFALPLGALVARCPIGRSDVLAGGLVVVGLATFLTVAAPAGGRAEAPIATWVAVGAGGAVTMGAFVLLAGPRPGVRRATTLGAAAGIANALVAVFSKASAHLLAHGLLHAATSWQPYALVAAGVASLMLSSSAFQAGSLAASLPVLTVVDPVAATIIGRLFFGESLTISGMAPLAEVGGIAAIVAGVFMLGNSPLVQCTQGAGAAESGEYEAASRSSGH
ncbi:MAG TPA: DMT family transporter [Actinomycetota bacterium]|nr:DMT family transporter [Actinomycetota bacterium]